jgi:hypothetical protein
MAKAKTPDSRNFLEKGMDRMVRSTRPDVNLPLSAGQEPDPRLPSSKAAATRKSLTEAGKGLKTLRSLGSR